MFKWAPLQSNMDIICLTATFVMIFLVPLTIIECNLEFIFLNNLVKSVVKFVLEKLI